MKIKVMPSSPETNLDELKEKLKEKLKQAGALNVDKIEEEEVAFGLKALIITAPWPEEQETSKAEDALKEVEDVSSVDIIDYRRAFG